MYSLLELYVSEISNKIENDELCGVRNYTKLDFRMTTTFIRTNFCEYISKESNVASP